ncbi:MAG: NAD(P)/FAD-dependent oxidoreductase [Euryarchaeota archaeon]|nr:NAD(P)/FAD-dependent oxidoreductase [Euryarchaeota archaeon]
MSEEREFDVIIVGGGPAGITAGIRCSSHNLSTLLLEARKLGGQLTQLYPTKYVLDYSSHPDIRAGYLADLMVHHAREKGVRMAEGAQVRRIEPSKDGFIVTAGADRYGAKAVILAIGMGVFEPMRLGVEGEGRFEDKGVSYAVPNLEIYRGLKVLVVGGGDTAIENAIGLSQVARVTLAHRRDSFRATEANVSILKRSLVQVLYDTEVTGITGDERAKRAALRDVRTGLATEIDVDAVIVNIGFAPDLSLVKNLRVRNDGRHILVEDMGMGTNVPGIFACGDIVDYAGKARLIQPAAAEGVLATEGAHRHIAERRSRLASE